MNIVSTVTLDDVLPPPGPDKKKTPTQLGRTNPQYFSSPPCWQRQWRRHTSARIVCGERRPKKSPLDSLAVETPQFQHGLARLQEKYPVPLSDWFFSRRNSLSHFRVASFLGETPRHASEMVLFSEKRSVPLSGRIFSRRNAPSRLRVAPFAVQEDQATKFSQQYPSTTIKPKENEL